MNVSDLSRVAGMVIMLQQALAMHPLSKLRMHQAATFSFLSHLPDFQQSMSTSRLQLSL